MWSKRVFIESWRVVNCSMWISPQPIDSPLNTRDTPHADTPLTLGRPKWTSIAPKECSKERGLTGQRLKSLGSHHLSDGVRLGLPMGLLGSKQLVAWESTV